MADVDTRSHGGDDDGDDPSRRLYRPPSGGCASSKKKTRGPNRNLKMFKKVENQKSRLPIRFDMKGKQYSAIGENYSAWIRAIGSMVGAGGFHYSSWDHVPDIYKANLFRFLEAHFNLESYKETSHWPWIIEGITADCRARFNNRKNREKSKFDQRGGCDNEQVVRQNPPQDYDPEMWGKLVDLFCSEEHKKRSAANTKNRSKQKYPSRHGSCSYANGRDQAGEGYSCIDHWAKMHSEKDGTWLENSEADWEKIQEELEHMKSIAAEGGDLVDELKCLKTALGPRRGFSKGFGRIVKQPSHFGLSSASGSSSHTSIDDRFARMEEEIRKLKEQLSAKKKAHSTNEDEDEGDEGDEDDYEGA